jgi:hypothetical protein
MSRFASSNLKWNVPNKGNANAIKLRKTARVDEALAAKMKASTT